ncbi:MAG: protoheme IX farnesyltransferase [Chloroflexi bacterium]|nr:protoheme IX farnesyltransferase [Chloroflexota bacterium]
MAQVAASQTLVRDYVALTKPRIIVLLLVTALGGMFLASQGAPEASLIILVLGGGTLASGGANAMNHALDKDIDERMDRTKGRPVVTGRIDANQALAFGIALNLLAFTLLSTMVNPLSAALTLSATLFYVLVYTKVLKRTTPQNIVIGGAAGAIPPMVGWTAVTGQIDLPALYLFAIVFFWTPPHFWALSLILKDDYARAGVPMLPVVAGVDKTKTSILLYSVLLLALTLMFGSTVTSLDGIYLGASLAFGAGFVGLAWRLKRRPDIEGARLFFFYSILYLAALFLAIMIDSAV